MRRNLMKAILLSILFSLRHRSTKNCWRGENELSILFSLRLIYFRSSWTGDMNLSILFSLRLKNIQLLVSFPSGPFNPLFIETGSVRVIKFADLSFNPLFIEAQLIRALYWLDRYISFQSSFHWGSMLKEKGISVDVLAFNPLFIEAKPNSTINKSDH